MKILTNNPNQTKKVGEILAKEILKIPLRKQALIFGLVGDLGGGKTTFLQGFAKGLGVEEKILSPSFVILKKFKVKSSKFKVFYHIDCYRVEKPKEILDLGFKEIVSNPKNLVAIEWADRIKKILPKKTLILRFDFLNRDQRTISVRIRNS